MLAAYLIVGAAMFHLGRRNPPTGIGGRGADPRPLAAAATGRNLDDLPKRFMLRQKLHDDGLFPETPQGKISRLQFILSNPNAFSRGKDLSDFLADRGPEELRELIDHLQGQGWSPHYTEGKRSIEAQGMAYGLWAKLDPASAGEFLESHQRDQPTDCEMAASIASVWGNRDPDAAVAWVKTRPGFTADPLLKAMMDAAIGAATKLDPSKGLDLVNQLSSEGVSGLSMQGSAKAMASKSDDERARWIGSLQDEDLKSTARNQLAEQLGHADPKAAVDWLLTTNSGDDGQSKSNTALRRIYENWMQTESAQATAYFEKLPNEEDRRFAISGVIANIVQNIANDLDSGTAEFVKGHAGDIDRQGFESLSNISWYRDYSVLYEGFARFDGSAQAAQRVVGPWLGQDPVSAQAYFDENHAAMDPEALRVWQNAGVISR